MPLMSLAAGLVPCGDTNPNDCNFTQLIEMFKRIFNYLVLISIPLAAIGFAYAGWIYITSGGEGGVRRAHDIFQKIATGFILILAAWLIVYTLSSALLKSNFTWLQG